MASSKGTTAELDSLVCIRIDRPSRMNAFKPKGSFCKVLAVIEVRESKLIKNGEVFVVSYYPFLSFLSFCF